MQFSLKRIYILYLNEIDKHLRQRFPWIALILLAMAGLLMARNADLLSTSGELSGYVIVILGIIMSITSFIPLLVIIFCSTLVAGEISSGTSRLILTRAVTRFEFLTAKLLIGISFAMLLLLFYILVLVIVSAGKYDFTPVLEDGEVIMTQGQLIRELAVALLLTILPLTASVAYALLISVLCKSLSTAIGTTVGIIAALDIFKHFLVFGEFDFKKYMFTTYESDFFGVVESMSRGLDVVWFDPQPELGSLIVPIVSIVVFLTLAYWRFLRSDVHE